MKTSARKIPVRMLLGALLILGSAAVCHRFRQMSGYTLWNGTGELRVSGDLQLRWEGRRVRASRTSEVSWPQGYGIEVHGGSSGGFLSLVTTTKPASGRYPIGRSARVDGVSPDVSHYDAMFFASKSLDAYQSDSGWIELRRKLGGMEGKFLIYLSERSAQPHRIVVSGSFR